MSASIEESLAYLRQMEDGYVPGRFVEDLISDITMLPVIGASATGKDTVMETACSMDEEFGKVRSFTTRPWREDDKPGQYRYYPHEETSLAGLAAQVRRGELVQYRPYASGYIYGSEGVDYTHPYMLLDTMSTAMDRIRAMPFKAVQPIGLVCLRKPWLERFQSKGFSPEETITRLKEGARSMMWLFSQPDIAWVDNTNDAAGAARQVVDIARGVRNPEKETQAKQIGESLLEGIEFRLRKLGEPAI